jgi:hypothetical protein
VSTVDEELAATLNNLQIEYRGEQIYREVPFLDGKVYLFVRASKKKVKKTG